MDEALQALGDRVRTLRLQQELSQARFAAKCGLSASTVDNIENARKAVRLDTLFVIAHCLGVSASKLLSDLNPFKNQSH